MPMVTIRMTNQERDALKLAAWRRGQSFQVWALRVLTTAATQPCFAMAPVMSREQAVRADIERRREGEES